MLKEARSGLAVAAAALLLAFPGVGMAAKNVLIVNGASNTSEPGTTADITANLQTLETAAGNTTTVMDVPPASLAGFDEVWDIRFSNTWPLTAGDQSLYLAFLQAGHQMFIMGENAGFATRNNSVIAFVTAAGGGALSFTTPGQTQTVNPPFTGPNPVTTITWNAGGGTSSPGAGAYATNAGTDGTAVAWGPGHLSNATSAALVVVFDVNFMQAGAGVDSPNFLKNLIGFINAGGGPVAAVLVPTMGNYSLVLLALVLAAGSFMVLRRRG